MGYHSSHKSLEAIDIARSQGLVLICLPPHTTHRMQPLDRTICGPLKVNYNAECGKWVTQNGGRPITQYDQAALFGQAYIQLQQWRKHYQDSVAVVCGRTILINVFNAEDSLPSMVTDEPQPSDSQQQIQPSTVGLTNNM